MTRRLVIAAAIIAACGSSPLPTQGPAVGVALPQYQELPARPSGAALVVEIRSGDRVPLRMAAVAADERIGAGGEPVALDSAARGPVSLDLAGRDRPVTADLLRVELPVGDLLTERIGSDAESGGGFDGGHERSIYPSVDTVKGRIGTVLLGGRASWVRASLGPRYLALRLPRGTLVRICGKACVLRVTTDYGPSSRIRPRRVADLSAADFRVVCGPLRLGVCKVSAELVETIEMPATDSE